MHHMNATAGLHSRVITLVTSRVMYITLGYLNPWLNFTLGEVRLTGLPKTSFLSSEGEKSVFRPSNGIQKRLFLSFLFVPRLRGEKELCFLFVPLGRKGNLFDVPWGGDRTIVPVLGRCLTEVNSVEQLH
jgi:hypothetical protein